MEKPQGENPYRDLFFTLLDTLSAHRGHIAKEAGMVNWKKYGCRRDSDGTETFNATVISKHKGHYIPCATSVIAFLQRYSGRILKGEAATFVRGNDYSGFNVEVLPVVTVDEAADINNPLKPPGPPPSEPDSQELQPLYEAACKSYAEKETAFRERLLKLLSSDPKKYAMLERYLMQSLYRRELLPDQGELSDLPLSVAQAEIYLAFKGVPVTVARYIAIFSSEGEVAARMLSMEKYRVQIMHMNKSFIPFALEDIAGIFERVITVKFINANQLKCLLAEFRHKFTFARPFENGGTAIAEWFEFIMCNSLGFDCALPEDTRLDLECYATPFLPHYMEDYGRLMKVARLLPQRPHSV